MKRNMEKQRTRKSADYIKRTSSILPNRKQ